ncbi:MAG: MoxR family ATPase [Candidatus Latescibacterota bacterium]|nr:MAG: MoxR family ATPase [Candidatus Latescibacterota bacterium]
MNPASDQEQVQELERAYRTLQDEIAKVIIGQKSVIQELLIALFSGGNCLLVGVPGLAKTLMISTLSKTLSLKFSRIQFTPDLMPSDITGTEILEEDVGTGKRVFKFLRGPVFANVILADEINRTPPKTQAALLQAMQEHEVTAGGETFGLDLPFFVLATQNPIEQEGTYPLPEAQLDRFMFNIKVDYPSVEEELEIVDKTTKPQDAVPQAVLDATSILRFQQLVRRVPVASHVIQYAVRLARATRPGADDGRPIHEFVGWGAGPRAGQHLVLGAKARAVLEGRPTPAMEDVQVVAPAVLRHRIVTNFNAEAEGVSTDALVERLLEEIRE